MTRVLDRAAAIDRLGLDEELVDEFIESLVKRSRAMASEIASAVDRGDCEQIEALGHSIKGAAATLEANALAEAARRIELLAHRGELAQCRAASTDLAEAVEELAAVAATA